MPRIKTKSQSHLPLKNTKKFWPCGDNTGLGCGKECWEGGVPIVLTIKLPGKRPRNVVFCSKCTKTVKNRNTLMIGS